MLVGKSSGEPAKRPPAEIRKGEQIFPLSFSCAVRRVFRIPFLIIPFLPIKGFPFRASNLIDGTNMFNCSDT